MTRTPAFDPRFQHSDADLRVTLMTDQTETKPRRSSTMYLIHEELARAHTNERRAQARRGARAARLSRAQRLQRRAEAVALRARRATAQALL